MGRDMALGNLACRIRRALDSEIMPPPHDIFEKRLRDLRRPWPKRDQRLTNGTSVHCLPRDFLTTLTTHFPSEAFATDENDVFRPSWVESFGLDALFFLCCLRGTIYVWMDYDWDEWLRFRGASLMSSWLRDSRARLHSSFLVLAGDACPWPRICSLLGASDGGAVTRDRREDGRGPGLVSRIAKPPLMTCQIQ